MTVVLSPLFSACIFLCTFLCCSILGWCIQTMSWLSIFLCSPPNLAVLICKGKRSCRERSLPIAQLKYTRSRPGNGLTLEWLHRFHPDRFGTTPPIWSTYFSKSHNHAKIGLTWKCLQALLSTLPRSEPTDVGFRSFWCAFSHHY